MLTRRHLLSGTAAAALLVSAGFRNKPALAQESSNEIEIKRRFIRVGDRHVHYLRGGSGPPVVLIHASPSDSSTMRGYINALGNTYTCFAFDSPGFGRSDPLPVEKMNCTDIGDSVAETMTALGIEECPVFGTHTGAAVALELGARHPDRVAGLVLDGVPIFNQEELADFDGYFAPLNIDAYGGHYAATWTRFRDQSLWFPWQDQRPEWSNGRAPSSAQNVHNGVMRFYLCAANYAPAYRSAVFYGEQAVKSAAALETPAIMTAVSPDMLFPHMDRLPPLKPNQEIVRLGEDRNEKIPVIQRGFAQYSDGGEAPADNSVLSGGAGIGKQFVDLPTGQVMVRYSGDSGAGPIVVIHDSPGSSQALEPLIEDLGRRGRVIALDLPGCGESGPLPGEAPSIMDFADVVAGLCEQLGIDSAGVYGIGIGSSVAIALKSRSPDLVSRLAVHSVLLPGAEERADLRTNYAPPIPIKDNGSHWYDTWMMLRDSLIMWPWYSTDASGRRDVTQDFSAQRLHDWTFEVMKQRESYHHVIHAAIDYHAFDALAQISGPVLTCMDPGHRFAVYDDRLRSITPEAQTLSVASSNHTDELATFLTA